LHKEQDHASSRARLLGGRAGGEGETASVVSRKTSSPASSSREDGDDKGKAAAVKDAGVTGEHGKGAWGQELKWAVAHGMPEKLAYNKDKTVQVRSRVSLVGWGWGEVQVVLGRRGSWRARKGRELLSS
jgi:hypothetical protein